MRIYRGIDEIEKLNNPVVAVGSFDGVHLGHCRILQYLCDSARRIGGQSVVVTFDPHPQELLRPESDFLRINTLDENLDLIAKQGVDVAVVIPFTHQFSKLSFVEFMEQVLIGKLQSHTLVMGPDHTMGHGREGNRQQIEHLCAKHQLQVVEIPELLIKDAGVHSAKIRSYLRDCQYEDADRMLGYHYQPKA